MAFHNFIKERQKENKIQALKEQREADKKEMAKTDLEKRADNRRLLRRLHEEKKDSEMENRIFKAREAEMVRKCEIDQEERLAQQMDYMKREELREIKLRQHLRENCVELRELEAQLKAAYSAKELVAQCAEKKAAEALEKMYERKALAVLKESWEKERQGVLEEQQKHLDKKFEYRRDLQDQIIAAEKSRQRAYYEFLQEKHLIDEITAKILEEDCKLEEEKFLKKARAREEISAFMKQREEERKKRKIEIEEEDKRYKIFLEQRALRDDEVRRLNMEKDAKKEELTYRLGTQLYEQEISKMERTEMLLELQGAQARSADEAKHQAELEAEIRRRLELREMSLQQKGERERRLREEAEDDRRWRDEMLAKCAEDERLEQFTREKRWSKMQEHRRAVEKLLEDRRAARAEEMQRLLKEREQEECLEAARRKMIEEERIQMLREHAETLLGYLPRGVLRADDLPHLRSDIVNKFCKVKLSDEDPAEDNCECEN